MSESTFAPLEPVVDKRMVFEPDSGVIAKVAVLSQVVRLPVAGKATLPKEVLFKSTSNGRSPVSNA